MKAKKTLELVDTRLRLFARSHGNWEMVDAIRGIIAEALEEDVVAIIEKAFTDPVEFVPTGWRETYPALREPDKAEIKLRLLEALT